MNDIELGFNSSPTLTTISVGEEQTKVVWLDDVLAEPDMMIEQAGSEAHFNASASDFYPGQRNQLPQTYLAQLVPLLSKTISQTYYEKHPCQLALQSASFCLTTTPANQLKPIQMLPHVDTQDDNIFAVVHYLCMPPYEGTALYRHKATGFERISQTRLAEYGPTLKQQAMQQQLHLNPQYMDGSNALFEQIASVELKYNRLVLYPANLLHSGMIKPALGLSADPKQGRLTANALIKVNI